MNKELKQKIKIYLILRHSLPTLEETIADVRAVFNTSEVHTKDYIHYLWRKRIIRFEHLSFEATVKAVEEFFWGKQIDEMKNKTYSNVKFVFNEEGFV